MTVYAQNGGMNSNEAMRFGATLVCVGDDSDGPLADGNSCTTAFYDGGFFTVNLTGRYVYIFRDGDGTPDHYY